MLRQPARHASQVPVTQHPIDIHSSWPLPGDAIAAGVGGTHGTRSQATLCVLDDQGPGLQTGGLPAPLAPGLEPCHCPPALLLGGGSAGSPPMSGSNLGGMHHMLAMPTPSSAYGALHATL